MDFELQKQAWELLEQSIVHTVSCRSHLESLMYAELKRISDAAIELHAEHKWGHPFPELVLVRRVTGNVSEISGLHYYCILQEKRSIWDELFQYTIELHKDPKIDISMEQVRGRPRRKLIEWDAREFIQALSNRIGRPISCSVELPPGSVRDEAGDFDVEPENS
jgi:hypothetical protein